MKFKTFLTGLLLTLGLALSHTTVAADSLPSQVQKIKNTGVLNVGVKQDAPNFSYLDPKTGKYTGMEIDLAKKIAEEIGVKVNYVPVTPQTRGALLDNGQIDLVLATFTITPERLKLFNFTSPYYTDASGFLINSSSGYKTLEDLNGKTIGIAQGSITRTLLNELAKEKHVHFSYVELGSYPEIAVALRAHRVDAFSVDQSILSGFRGKGTEIMNLAFKSANYGAATKKSNKELADYLSTLIDKYQKDGTMKQIYDKFELKPVTSAKEGGNK